MGEKSSKLAGITALVFMFYIYASILTDAAYTFFNSTIGDLIYKMTGIFALAFVVLTFAYAVAEKNKPILAFYAIIFLIIILGAIGGG